MRMERNHTSVTLCRSSFNSSAAVRPNAICSTLFDPKKNLFFQLKTKTGVGKRNISTQRERNWWVYKWTKVSNIWICQEFQIFCNCFSRSVMLWGRPHSRHSEKTKINSGSRENTMWWTGEKKLVPAAWFQVFFELFEFGVTHVFEREDIDWRVLVQTVANWLYQWLFLHLSLLLRLRQCHCKQQRKNNNTVNDIPKYPSSNPTSLPPLSPPLTTRKKKNKKLQRGQTQRADTKHFSPDAAGTEKESAETRSTPQQPSPTSSWNCLFLTELVPLGLRHAEQQSKRLQSTSS